MSDLLSKLSEENSKLKAENAILHNAKTALEGLKNLGYDYMLWYETDCTDGAPWRCAEWQEMQAISDLLNYPVYGLGEIHFATTPIDAINLALKAKEENNE